MRIGLLTFHYAYNFGALLQAYALQEYLREKGNDVEIIDYRNPAIEASYDYDSWGKFCQSSWREKLFLIRFWLNASYHWHRRIRHFKQFVRRHLHLTTVRYDAKLLETAPYDAYVIGSDQVWNTRLTGGFDPCYWGDFSPRHSHVKVAYAASCGKPEFFSPADKEKIRAKLRNFSCISVREDTLREFLHGLSPVSPRLVPDPTLLVERETFQRITGKRVFPFPYVLVYAVEKHPALLNCAKKIAGTRHARVVLVEMKTCKTTLWPPRDFLPYDPTFPELLSLFKYADCTVTLSFHGVALSLIYEKEFYALRGSSMDRVMSLLGQIGLDDRVIDGERIPLLPMIDYVSVNKELDFLRRDADNFLQKALSFRPTGPLATRPADTAT